MAKPVKPKDLKPKTSEPEAASAASPGAPSPSAPTEAPAGSAAKPASGGGALDLKFIITVVVILISTAVTSIGSIYFLAPMALVPAIVAKLPHSAGPAEGEAPAEGEEGEAPKKPEAPRLGQNLELDEFTANLKDDPELGGTQYVRTKMALSIGVPKEEDCAALKEAAAKDPKAAAPAHGEGGEGAAKEGPDPCMTEFNTHMAPFVPTIRDIVNSSLMAHSADELASPKGQEKFKDSLKKQITAAMAPKYTVMRVNFQDFIIQK